MLRRFLQVTISILVIFIILVFSINLYFYFKAKNYIYSDLNKIPKTEAVLVLGASVSKDGRLLPVLQDRVETAIELYRADKVSKILVAGDNSRVTYNEVNPVQKYLIKQGIPAQDIFLDHAGFDTYDSIYRAKEIFGVSSIIISTQRFHLNRSIYIARSLGIESYGFPADRREYLLKNSLRERLAALKAFMDVNLHTKPKFLGEKIPIDGDGRETWY